MKKTVNANLIILLVVLSALALAKCAFHKSIPIHKRHASTVGGTEFYKEVIGFRHSRRMDDPRIKRYSY